MIRRLLPLLLVAGALGACGDDPEPAGPRREPEPEPPVPTELRTDWKRVGSGEAFALAAADFDGDGQVEVAVGGRRTSVVRQGSLEPVWIDGWFPAEDDSVLMNGENDWAEALAVVPRDGAPPALLSCNSRGDAHLRDGATGAVLWGKSLDLEFPYCDVLAMIGPEDAPLFVPRFGATAYDARTGEEVWTADLPRPPAFVVPARIAGEPMGLVTVSDPEADDVQPASGASVNASKTIPPWVHSLSADGKVRWSVSLGQKDYLAAVGAGDLSGSGADAPIIGMWDGRLVAFDDGGSVRWEKSFPLFGKEPARTFYQALFARDVDGDGRDEIIAVIADGKSSNTSNGAGLVLALSADGEELWRQPFTRPVEHASLAVLAGEDVLLLGLGPRDRSFAAQALALRLAPDAEKRFAVELNVPHAVYSMAVIPDAGGDRLAIGSIDGRLRVVEASGASAWGAYTTTWIQGMTEVPGGDAGDMVAFGDEFATVALVDSSGELVWARPMGVQTTGMVTAIAAGELGDGRGPSIVAAAFVADPVGMGLVEIHTSKEERVRSIRLPGIPHALAIGRDLGGHPAIFVLQGFGASEKDCRLDAFAGADLTPLWDVALPVCARAGISVGDLDDDGVDELVIRMDAPGRDSAFLAVVGADGEIRDLHQESLQLSLWAHAVPGGVLSGGTAIGSQGFVEFRPMGGSRQGWRILVEPTTDESNPRGTPITGSALFGILVPDRSGDGIDEVAISTAANAVLLLDGATGETLWSTAVESTALISSEKHLGGPLAFLPGFGDLPPALVMAQGSDHRSRSAAFALSLDGEIIGSVPLDAQAFDARVVRRNDDSFAAVVGAGHGLYSLRTHPVAP